MALRSPAEAIRQGRRLLGLPDGEEGAAFAVRRLDRPDSSYFLVHADGRLVCVDQATGALIASAQSALLPIVLTAEVAASRSGLGAEATAELVWTPSPASRSMFDPIWAVSHGAQTVYVDQRGHTWDALDAKRRGG